MPDPEDLGSSDLEERQTQDRQALSDRIAAGTATVGDIRRYASVVLEQRALDLENNTPEEITGLVLDQLQADLGPAVEVDDRTAGWILRHIEYVNEGGPVLSDRSAVRNKRTGLDPIELFSGEFTHEATDLKVNGAGLDLAFRRAYRSGASHFGALGARWSHPYEITAFAEEDLEVTVVIEGRNETYTRHPRFGDGRSFDYFAPPDGVHAIVRPVGDSFVRRQPDGLLQLFEVDRADDLRHRLHRIEDRFGNFLDFAYDDRLLRRIIVNHPARTVDFAYDPEGRVVEVVDFTGRVWRYTYDDHGDLVLVVAPDRSTTCFEYSTSSSPGIMDHLLERIIDGSGRLYLENEYGGGWGRSDFKRVIRQRQGGGETLLEYELVDTVFDREYSEADRPAHQTNMVARSGQQTHHVYNRHGNLILLEHDTTVSGVPVHAVWRHRYNKDGERTATLSPQGVLTQSIYGRDFFERRFGDEEPNMDLLTAEERQGFGRLRATVRRGNYVSFTDFNLAVGAWGDIFPDALVVEPSRDVIVKFDYESKYGQLRAESDPRFTNSPDPTADEHPLHEASLTTYEYSGPPEDPKRLLSAISRAGAVERFTDHDARGRMLRRVDPAGVVTSYDYFRDGDGVQTGHLRRRVVDPDHLSVTTLFVVDDLGRVVEEHAPRATGDGRFVAKIGYDEHDRVISITTSEPFAVQTRRIYDGSGALIRETQEAEDETGAALPGGPLVRALAYNEELHVVREASGGAEPATWLITRHIYDGAGQETLRILPAGNRIRTRWNVRQLPSVRTRGFGTADAASILSAYDSDGRLVRSVDGRGLATELTLDPLGRVVAERDPLGRVTRRRFDKAGNLLVDRMFEVGQGAAFNLVARAEYEYDLFGRLTRVGENAIESVPAAFDLDEAFLQSPGPGELLNSLTFYDAKGRVVRAIDPLAHMRTVTYDALDRPAIETDAMGSRLEWHYDTHGNVTRRDDVEVVRDPTDGAALFELAFSRTASYDELDRRTSETDGLGNTTVFRHDSRGNVVRTMDPLGHVVLNRFDLYNRRVSEIREMTNGVSPAVIAQAVTRFEYDANGNLAGTVDAEGRVSRYKYDALDRLTDWMYPDGSSQRLAYDRNDNVLDTRDPNGVRRLSAYNASNQLVRVDVDESGLEPDASVEGATFEAYRYNGLGRMIEARNDFAVCRMRYDSLGRALEESVEYTFVGSPPGQTLSRRFDANGALVELRYPGGRTVALDRDDLDRATGFVHTADGSDYPGGTGLLVPRGLAVVEFGGRMRLRTRYPSGQVTSYDYDAAGRTIQIAHRLGVGEALVMQYLHDGAAHPRLRNDVSAAGSIGEVYRYDSLHRLVEANTITGVAAFDPTLLGPTRTVPPEPIPNRQADVDVLIPALVGGPGRAAWRLDLVGNRVEESRPNGQVLSYEINTLDQYTRRGQNLYTYDRAGNLIDDAGRRHVYDSRHRLVRVTADGSNLFEYVHDALGRRVGALFGGTVRSYVYDGERVIAEYRDGVQIAQFVYDDMYGEPLHLATEGGERWLHCDALGSVRLLSDLSANQVAAYVYDSFGDHASSLDATPQNPLRYLGMSPDPDVRSYQLGRRSYRPDLGRFLQRDPAGMADGTNLYAYAGNNPLRYTDTSGLGREERAGENAALRKAIGDLVEKPFEAVSNVIEALSTEAVEKQADVASLNSTRRNVNDAARRLNNSLVGEAAEFMDSFLDFYLGPALAAKELAEADSAFERARSIFYLATAVAQKYTIVLEAGKKAGLITGARALTVARLVRGFGALGAAAAVGELSYKFGRLLDEATGLSDWISDVAARAETRPWEYPKTTIYEYLRRGRAIPPDVQARIRTGLTLQGQSWPSYEEYPKWLKDDLRRRTADALLETRNVFDAILPFRSAPASGAARSGVASPQP